MRIIFNKIIKFKKNIVFDIISLLVTFHCIVLSFALIRCSSVNEYFNLIKSLFSFTPGLKIPGEIKYYGLFILFIVFIIDVIRYYNIKLSLLENYKFKFIYIASLILMTIFLSNDYNKAYIYFRF